MARGEQDKKVGASTLEVVKKTLNRRRSRNERPIYPELGNGRKDLVAMDTRGRRPVEKAMRKKI